MSQGREAARPTPGSAIPVIDIADDEPGDQNDAVIPNPDVPAVAEQAAGAEANAPVLECVICIEPCVHPVELPCKHIFCFLCIKGVTVQAHQHAMTPKCSICRREIPAYVLTHPRLMEPAQLYRTSPASSEYQWFYEARGGGWWQFEERLMVDLERAFSAQQTNCQLLIAGQMYEVDFEQMIQYRAGHVNLARRIKRDLASAPRKGIAGIRMGANGDAGSSSGDGGPPQGNHSALSGPFFDPSRPWHDQYRPIELFTGPVSYGAQTQNGNTLNPNPDSDEDADEDYTSSDEDDDEVELVQEEESDDDSEDEDEVGDSPDCVRDGARAPTSRSDRSTSSSNTNQTPPPLSAKQTSSGSGSHKVGSRGSSRNTLTTPTSATPPNADGSSGNSNGPTPSPTHRSSAIPGQQRATIFVVSPSVRLTLDADGAEVSDEVL